MFKPIIHNLDKEHPAYGAVTKYNLFVSLGKKHFTGKCTKLEDKIRAEKEWKAYMENALKEAQELLKR